MRLITRADFDGLACAVILKDLGIIDTWKFVDHKDIQNSDMQITDRDVLANVPYIEGCSLWFGHHSSEEERIGKGVVLEETVALSSITRIVYDYYGGKETMPYFEEMVAAVDKIDSGLLTKEDIVEPAGWILLGFIMDSHTGLGCFDDFTMSNKVLMDELIENCHTLPIEDVLTLPNVQERVEKYGKHVESFKEMLLKHSHIDWEVIITDLRGVSPIYTGNRFLIYTLFPAQNISIWVTKDKNADSVLIAVGYSVLNRTARADVGSLMLKYGGRGHYRAGTCRVSCDRADQILAEIVKAIREAYSRKNLPNEEMSNLLNQADNLLVDMD